jgi:hypothetical protein
LMAKMAASNTRILRNIHRTMLMPQPILRRSSRG